MKDSSVRLRLEESEERLSIHAVRSKESIGREIAESESPLRTAFQRDRDRIVHCKAFRRIKHKTQVFISPIGDHFVTRLTHTLEVSQIARTIARALNLNEDLVEAIALGHDMGHTPFGHVGESELGRLNDGGFRHNVQSLRLVDRIEKDGKGLNLTYEVRQGILHHSKPQGDFLAPDLVKDMTLEAQVIRISDVIAYLNHDLADAHRAGILQNGQIPEEIQFAIGSNHSTRINSMVSDIVDYSTDLMESGTGTVTIGMSESIREAMNELRGFMFTNVYGPEDIGEEGIAAREIIAALYDHFSNNLGGIPTEYNLRSESPKMAVIDYISGMTDRYAIRLSERLYPGIASIFLKRLV